MPDSYCPPPPVDPKLVCNLSHSSHVTAALTRAVLQGRLLTTMVDSGATSSCISSKWFNSLSNDIKSTRVLTPEFNAIGASSVPLVCLGAISLSVAFPNETWSTSHDFYIIDCLPYDALFGMDFITKHRGGLDMDRAFFHLRPINTRKLYMPLWWFPLGQDGPSSTISLFSLDNITLPPGKPILLNAIQ